MGVDLFLPDDGWFGNKYSRSNARAGLGDWQETSTKLPRGLDYLVEQADSQGVKFGIKSLANWPIFSSSHLLSPAAHGTADFQLWWQLRRIFVVHTSTPRLQRGVSGFEFTTQLPGIKLCHVFKSKVAITQNSNLPVKGHAPELLIMMD